MTDTERLVAFLEARISEDQRAAQAAADHQAEELDRSTPAGMELPAAGHWHVAESDEADLAVAVHVLRHDPARVLADCAAKRKIIEFWSLAYRRPEDFPGPDFDQVRRSARWTLLTLARAHAGHPAFDPTWDADPTPPWEVDPESN